VEFKTIIYPVLSQMKSVHSLVRYFCKISFDIAFPSMLWSSEWSLPFGFWNQNFVCFSPLSRACWL